jgi:hypothetical protein
VRAERSRQLAGLALALLVVGWLLLRGGDDEAERARLASEAEAAAAASAEEASARMRAARSGSERERSRAGEGESRRGDSDSGDLEADLAHRSRALAKDDGASTDRLGKSPPLPIHLNRLVVEENRPVVEITGLDPEAPRELVAWRIKNGRSAILVRGESDENGQLEFPPVIAAGSGLEVVITDADSRPEMLGASEVRKLAPRSPDPPQGRVLEAYEGEAIVRIIPTEGSGTVLLAGPDGTVFARYPISPTPAIGARAFDVALELYGDDPQLLMAHEFEDGRRSDWRVYSVGAPTQFEDLPETEDLEGFEGFGGAVNARGARGAPDILDSDY